MTEEIQKTLFELKDEEYRNFQAKLIPLVPIENIIGVRTPLLRKYAKSLCKREEVFEFLNVLPHNYFDENNLHGFIISEFKDYDISLEYVNKLLPYVDNWATCDLISPKSFGKNKSRLITDIDKWVSSDKPFTIRFGIEMLMSHFLDEDFKKEYLYKVFPIRSDEYYVKMMIAWFFATALAKKWESTVFVIEDKKLDKWVHNKTIQKAIESYRITTEQKEYLRSLKIL